MIMCYSPHWCSRDFQLWLEGFTYNQCLSWLQNCQYAKQGLVLCVPQFIRRNMRKPSPGSPMMARGVQAPEQPLNISVQWGRKAQILATLLWNRRHLSLHCSEKRKQNPNIFPQQEGPSPTQQTAEMSQSRPAEHQTNKLNPHGPDSSVLGCLLHFSASHRMLFHVFMFS